MFYAHCKSIKLKKGDKVSKGMIIAIMESTGASTGVHLHLGMTNIGSDKWIGDNQKYLEVYLVNDYKSKYEKLLAEFNSYKFKYLVKESGIYKIKLNKDEVFIIK